MTADDRLVLHDRELIELLADEPELLAILDAYGATQGRYWRGSARRVPKRVVWVVAAAVALLCVGGALAYFVAFGPLHNAQIVPDAKGPGACQLLGRTAADASTYFDAHGLTISWRFTRWPSASPKTTVTETAPGQAQAVGGGFTSAPETVPPDSVVWNISSVETDPALVIVFVEAPNDPDAPQLTLPDACRSQNGSGG